ncbi:MAG: leucine-rich repeat domain-containing protein [Prevotella sp.]|nr:leucine-rich repeat domain-containing protein [Prevotella sp.]
MKKHYQHQLPRTLLLLCMAATSLGSAAQKMVASYFIRLADGQEVSIALDPNDNNKAWIAPDVERTNYTSKNQALEGHVVIPATAKYGFLGNTGISSHEVTIVGVAQHGFYNCRKITRITLPNTVKQLGDEALNNCFGLKVLNLSSNIEKVGKYAVTSSSLQTLDVDCQAIISDTVYNPMFNYSPALQTLNIGENITYVGKSAFSSCQNLVCVNFGHHVERIGDQAFYNCPKLAHLRLPASIKEISPTAFSYGADRLQNTLRRIDLEGPSAYEALKQARLKVSNECRIYLQGADVTDDYMKLFADGGTQTQPQELPEGATEIPDYFFSGRNMTSYTIPASVRTIGNGAFSAAGLESITIPATVTSISDYAFANCSNLKEVIFEGTLKHLPVSVFQNCYQLEQVTWPQGLESIADDAFSWCSSLKEVTIPATVVSMSHHAFEYCPGINIHFLSDKTGMSFENGLLYNLQKDTLYSTTCFAGESLVLPEGVRAAERLEVYVPLTLPASFEQLPDNFSAFSFTVAEGNPFFSTIDMSLYDKEQKTLLKTRQGQSEEMLIIPATVEKIKDWAISGFPQIAMEQKLEMNDDALMTQLRAYGRTLFLHDDYVAYYNNRLSDFKAQQCRVYPYSQPMAISRVEVGALMARVDVMTGPQQQGTPTRAIAMGREFAYDAERKGFLLDHVTEFGTDVHIDIYGQAGGSELVLHDSIDLSRNRLPMLNQGENYSINRYYTHVEPCYIVNEPSPASLVDQVDAYGIDYWTQGTDTTTLTCKLAELDNSEPYRLLLRTTIDAEPGQNFLVRPFVIIDGQKYFDMRYGYASTSSWSTKDFVLSLNNVSYSPTTMALSFDFSPEELQVKEFGIDKLKNVKEAVLTGLTPGELRTAECYAKVHLGSRDSTFTQTLTALLPQLVLTTLPAKATSQTSALIQAQTNLAPEETGAGFEWRRYDAPDIMPSTQSQAMAWDGLMQGTLHNLSANTYYAYRPYCKLADGNTLYGEWMALMTGDTDAYFEPLMHMAGVSVTGENTCLVTAYVVEGSEPMADQGFEYWKAGGSARLHIPALLQSEHEHVAAQGMRMTATLEGLEPGTIYNVRAYATTARETTYSSTMQFLTQGVSAIDGTLGDGTQPTELERYDAQGRRVESPVKGLNIVRYDDGSVRRIVVR